MALGPLFSPRLVDLVRSDRSVVCVLNRTGRARLLACTSCSTLARCAVCDAAVHQVETAGGGEGFGCARCGTERPLVCLECGGHRFKNLRLGVGYNFTQFNDDLTNFDYDQRGWFVNFVGWY